MDEFSTILHLHLGDLAQVPDTTNPTNMHTFALSLVNQIKLIRQADRLTQIETSDQAG